MTTANANFSNPDLMERLPPLIRAVLNSPGIVVSQVSAKFVRKALVDQHGVDKNDLNTDKQAVNDLIHQIFTEIYPSAGNGGNNGNKNGAATPTASKAVPTTPMKSMSIAASSPAVPLEKVKGKRKKVEEEEDDEVFARRLQESFNGERSTRGSSAGSISNKRKKGNNDAGGKSKSTKGGRVKSKAYIDDADDEDGSESGSDTEDGGAKAKAKKKSKKSKSKAKAKDKEGGGGARGGFAKPFLLRWARPCFVVKKS
jgi:upstream activation factor subunit UAF30